MTSIVILPSLLFARSIASLFAKCEWTIESNNLGYLLLDRGDLPRCSAIALVTYGVLDRSSAIAILARAMTRSID
ncbi:hypothetical protein [Chamaesiphon sp.]|uniref:hypothetical protein n=1 Tax=Chamaesiphon sp. TaxID=2814140 RepID=UPI0035938E33